MLLDYIIIGFILFFVLFGFIAGFVNFLVFFIGLSCGSIVAGYSIETVSFFFPNIIFSNRLNFTKLILFIIIMLFVNGIVGYFLKYIIKLYKIFEFLPFVTTLNRIAGALLGFVQGIIMVMVLLYIAVGLPTWPNFTEILIQSSLVRNLLVVTEILSPLLPQSFKNLKNII
jgi:uncharacterized membrane protein required for colicin V production